MKAILQEDDEEVRWPLRDFIYSQLDKFFIDHIPIESFRELPAVYMYYFGSVAYMATIALFIFFTYTNYRNTVVQPFISISNDANCHTVPISVTSEYLADNQGNWVGDPSFVYALAPYSLSLSNFEVSSNAQYQDMMLTFQRDIDVIGAISVNQNLPENLMYWMSYIKYYSVQNPSATNFTTIGHGQLQYIQMTGNPAQVFDLSYTQAHFISQTGYCRSGSYGTYDQANALLSARMNYTDFVMDPTCNTIVDPASFGYYGAVNQGLFTPSLDVLSFSTAMAVNLGILSIADLGVASTDFQYFTFLNVTYETGQYFDTRYPNMKTIICIQNSTAIPSNSKGVRHLCMLLTGQTLALPVFNHFGTNMSAPVYCDCATNGRSEACQNFNLLAGLLFYPAAPGNVTIRDNLLSNSGVFNLVLLAIKLKTYSALNRAAYNASFAAGAHSYGVADPVMDTTQWLASSFSFCQLSPTTQCSLLVFNSLDYTSKKVSQYKFQLANGSCQDSLTISDKYWDKVLQRPPAQLTQSYYECYESSQSALFASLGIASGNTALAVPLIVTLMLPLLYLLLVAIKQVPPKEEYTDPEKEQASEILSILLLRIRDGKTRGIRKNGVLMKLLKEISSAAQEESGFPDSDDEDDENDDEEASAQNSSNTRRSSKRKSSKTPRMIRTRKSGYVDSDDEVDNNVGGASVVDTSTIDSSRHRVTFSGGPGKVRQCSATSVASVTPMSFLKQAERNKMAIFVKKQPDPEPTPKRKSRTSGIYFPYLFSRWGGVNSPHLQSSLRQSRMPSERNSTAGRGDQEMVETHLGDAENPLSLTLYPDTSVAVAQSAHLHILNVEGPGVQLSRFSKQIQGNDIDMLVDDLLQLFGEALATRDSMCTDDVAGAYLQAGLLALKLEKVIISDLLGREDKTVFMKLSNALCMHAGIELNCGMRDIATQHADRVAYNIGGKVLTLSHLSGFM